MNVEAIERVNNRLSRIFRNPRKNTTRKYGSNRKIFFKDGSSVDIARTETKTNLERKWVATYQAFIFKDGHFVDPQWMFGDSRKEIFKKIRVGLASLNPKYVSVTKRIKQYDK